MRFTFRSRKVVLVSSLPPCVSTPSQSDVFFAYCGMITLLPHTCSRFLHSLLDGAPFLRTPVSLNLPSHSAFDGCMTSRFSSTTSLPSLPPFFLQCSCTSLWLSIVGFLKVPRHPSDCSLASPSYSLLRISPFCVSRTLSPQRFLVLGSFYLLRTFWPPSPLFNALYFGRSLREFPKLGRTA